MGSYAADKAQQVAKLASYVERLESENERLVSALERTERNLLLSIRQRPVRDLCENLAENAAALQGR